MWEHCAAARWGWKPVGDGAGTAHDYRGDSGARVFGGAGISVVRQDTRGCDGSIEHGRTLGSTWRQAWVLAVRGRDRRDHMDIFPRRFADDRTPAFYRRGGGL